MKWNYMRWAQSINVGYNKLYEVELHAMGTKYKCGLQIDATIQAK